MKTSEISKGISSQVFEVRKEIGAKLLQFRLEQGLSQSEAANLCGISTHRIQQIEKGYSLSLIAIWLSSPACMASAMRLP